MRPLRKAMNIAHMNKKSKKETLDQLLNNYRGNPQPVRDLSPQAMLVQDGKRRVFPRKLVTDSDALLARERDEQMKQERKEEINTLKHKKQD